MKTNVLRIVLRKLGYIQKSSVIGKVKELKAKCSQLEKVNQKLVVDTIAIKNKLTIAEEKIAELESQLIANNQAVIEADKRAERTKACAKESIIACELGFKSFYGGKLDA